MWDLIVSVPDHCLSFYFVSLQTKALYENILSRASWDSQGMITQEATEELKYWQINAKALNSKCKFIKENLDCKVEIFCDASAEAYVGYFVTKGKDECMNMSFISEYDFCKSIFFLQEAMRAENAQCCDTSTVAGNATCWRESSL